VRAVGSDLRCVREGARRAAWWRRVGWRTLRKCMPCMPEAEATV
jgi:hypothetical protein